jgi:hypothetical protein
MGTLSVSPAATATYIMTCSGEGGTASDSVTITVTAPAPVPVVNLSVSPAIIEQGQSATLSWTSTDADSCVASSGWSGTHSTMGTLSVSPAATATYIMTCSGEGGTASDSVIVTVNEPTSSGRDINLSWVAPSEREDNSALSMSEISGYKIYYGTTQGEYSNSIDVSDGTAEGYTITDLPSGVYYIVVTTIDTDGRESGFSGAININI